MDKEKANRIIGSVKRLLTSLKEEGVAFDISGSRYNTASVWFRVEISEKKSDMPPEEAEFRKYHKEFNLQLTDLHRKIKVPNGRKPLTLTITGLLPKGKVNIVAAEDAQGKRYKLPLDLVKAALKNPPSIKSKRSDSVILHEMRLVEMDLEPENLSKDGELSDKEIARAKSLLVRKRQDLEEELGRVPSEEEIWKK